MMATAPHRTLQDALGNPDIARYKVAREAVVACATFLRIVGWWYVVLPRRHHTDMWLLIDRTHAERFEGYLRALYAAIGSA
jgi:hypothetical protein